MANQDGIVCLSCESCGAALQIPSKVSQFACASCGVQQVVERTGGAVFLKGASDAIDRIQDSVEKTAAELAYRRLSEEYDAISSRLAAVRKVVKGKNEMAIAFSFILFGPFTLMGMFALLADGHPTVITVCLSIGLGGTLLMVAYALATGRRLKPMITRLEEEKARFADAHRRLATHWSNWLLERPGKLRDCVHVLSMSPVPRRHLPWP